MTFLTSTGEGILWSSIMYRQFQSSIIAGGVTFIVAFAMIWLTDTSIVLYDFSTLKNRSIRDYFNSRLINAVANFLSISLGTKIGWGIIGRTFAMLFAISITGPALMNHMLDTEISNEIRKDNNAKLKDIEEQVIAKYKPNINEAKARKDRLEKQFHDEMTGAGGTKKTGVGSVSKEFKNDRSVAQQHLEKLEADLQAELNSLNNLSSADIQNRYKVVLQSEIGLNERTKKIVAMMKDPNYRYSVLAIEGIVVFVFLMFIMIKLFQPRVVGIYLNASIQEEFRQWFNGNYDYFLPNELQSSQSAVIGPIGFEEKIFSRIGKSSTLSESELRLLRSRIELIKTIIRRHQSNLQAFYKEEESASKSLENAHKEADEIYKKIQAQKRLLSSLRKDQSETQRWIDENDSSKKRDLFDVAGMESESTLIEYLNVKAKIAKEKTENNHRLQTEIDHTETEIDTLGRREKSCMELVTTNRERLSKINHSMSEIHKMIESEQEKLDQIFLDNGLNGVESLLEGIQ